MKVEVRGYSRDCGWTKVVRADVASTRMPATKKWVKGDGANSMRYDDHFLFRKSPVRLTLSGRYIIDVEITKEEIKNLFFEAYADELKAFAGLEGVIAARE
ncbi:MAG: hypothetical protein V4574_07380 [Pseudomonadota bacterium]